MSQMFSETNVISPSSLNTSKNPSKAIKASFSSSTNFDKTCDFTSFVSSSSAIVVSSTDASSSELLGTKILIISYKFTISLQFCQLTKANHFPNFKIRNWQTHNRGLVEMVDFFWFHGQLARQFGEDFRLPWTTTSRCVARLFLALLIVPANTERSFVIIWENVLLALFALFWTQK